MSYCDFKFNMLYIDIYNFYINSSTISKTDTSSTLESVNSELCLLY